MKKLTKSVLAVVLSATFTVSYAQKSKVDSTKTKDIEGVVVTALGIKREKRALGYATQEVSGEKLSSTGAWQHRPSQANLWLWQRESTPLTHHRTTGQNGL